MGDHVIVVNIDKVIFTGNKLRYQKIYYHYTGHRVWTQETTTATLMQKKAPAFAFERAVKGHAAQKRWAAA